MAYINQYQADMQEDEKRNRIYSSIGNGLVGAVQGMEENRRRALDERARQEQLAQAKELQNAQMDEYRYKADQRGLDFEDRDSTKELSMREKLLTERANKTAKTRAEVFANRAPKVVKTIDDKVKEANALHDAKKSREIPLENKTIITKLAGKNADAEYIANSLESFLKEAEGYDDNQLLTQGRQLIKTMNSTLGPDATGAEEVKRLGSKLEFALGNVFNDNPTQFGRDLSGFRQQVGDTAKIMRGAIGKNKEQIQSQYGSTQKPAPTFKVPKKPEDISNMSLEELDAFTKDMQGKR